MPQENNMAEVIRLLHTVIGKVDLLSGRFEDVVRVVIENTQRIEGLEGRVDILESKAN